MEWSAATEVEMEELGEAAGAAAAAGTVIALVGGLGAGKTRWVKGLVRGLGHPGEVTSPTFSLVHEYRGGRLPVFHLDLYRLKSPEELLAIGWDEFFDEPGVVVVEWADLFPGLLPAGTRWLYFEAPAAGGRTIRSGSADGAAGR